MSMTHCKMVSATERSRKTYVVNLKCESSAYLEWMFRRSNTNGNGTLSPREFAAVEKTGPNDTNKARMRSESRRIAQYWASTDTNGDGRMTKTEFMALAERRFKEMDANGDAKISSFEYRAAKLF